MLKHSLSTDMIDWMQNHASCIFHELLLRRANIDAPLWLIVWKPVCFGAKNWYSESVTVDLFTKFPVLAELIIWLHLFAFACNNYEAQVP